MELSRRGFLKGAAGAAGVGMAYGLSSAAPALAVEASEEWKLVNTEEYTNICCYCAGGCGSLCSVRDGELINLEGDPDHPVNEGGLCPKGATKPLVRRPNSTEWEPISWEDAVKEIALKVKATRDKGFVETEMVKGKKLTVNRCESIASLGGSQQNSEEEYLILKMMRALGIVAIDNQARV